MVLDDGVIAGSRAFAGSMQRLQRFNVRHVIECGRATGTRTDNRICYQSLNITGRISRLPQSYSLLFIACISRSLNIASCLHKSAVNKYLLLGMMMMLP